MKFYCYILAMKKETFFILALLILWIWMIVWTFFWWSSDNQWNIQNSETWFIEQLNQSWDKIDDSAALNLPQINQPKKQNTTIRLMMPRFFYTAWFKNFAQDLYSQQKVYINFTFVDDLNEYRDKVQNSDFSEADLLLIPYDRIDSIQSRSFSFQQNLESAFDQLLSPILKENSLSFLPFSADPMIMYTMWWFSVQNNFSEISDFVYEWTPKKALSFPLFFWITSEDYDNEWFLWEYQDIMRYSFMHYFNTYRDRTSLSKRIDNNVFENYNIKNLTTITNALSESKCKNFPSICLQLYKFVWIRFWFFSDQDIVRQYFWNQKSEFEKTSKQSLPFSQIESPFRLRWRTMPDSLQDIDTVNWVYLFLSHYMNKHDSYSLRSSTLPVFTTNSGSNLIDNSFIWTRWYILSSWWNFIQNIRNTKAFWQLIEYQISAKDYIKKI